MPPIVGMTGYFIPKTKTLNGFSNKLKVYKTNYLTFADLFLPMISPSVLAAFHLLPYKNIQPLSAGLINHSYKVTTNDNQSYFLQQVNTGIFTQPERIQENYMLIQQHLRDKNSFQLPAIIFAGKDLLYEEEGKTWRCFQFLPHTYSPEKVHTAEKAYEVANCFGRFTAALHDLNVHQLHTILPDFHNLQYRYNQLLEALQQADESVKEDSKDLIQMVFDNQHLLHWFNSIQSNRVAYPVRIMHHDCKISNILFNKQTDALQCPIDLDTTQPGLFFSDLGDMIRTIVPSLNEDAANINDLTIRTQFYDAAVQGYLAAMTAYLTPEEKSDIHYSGLVLVYMQAIRFLADYLNNNKYYKVAYPEQNRDRTANQLRLLQLLQEYISRL